MIFRDYFTSIQLYERSDIVAKTDYKNTVKRAQAIKGTDKKEIFESFCTAKFKKNVYAKQKNRRKFIMTKYEISIFFDSNSIKLHEFNSVINKFVGRC